MLALKVNGKVYSVDVEPETPLLWVVRDTIGLTGTKYGCGIAMCGACTVHVNGKATRSCMTQVGRVAGQEITTIEGLGGTHPVQEAWREGDSDYASVALRFSMVDKTVDRGSGRLVEGSEQPTEATEVWTFVRPRGAGWELSAIQQAS